MPAQRLLSRAGQHPVVLAHEADRKSSRHDVHLHPPASGRAVGARHTFTTSAQRWYCVTPITLFVRGASAGRRVPSPPSTARSPALSGVGRTRFRTAISGYPAAGCHFGTRNRQRSWRCRCCRLSSRRAMPRSPFLPVVVVGRSRGRAGGLARGVATSRFVAGHSSEPRHSVRVGNDEFRGAERSGSATTPDAGPRSTK